MSAESKIVTIIKNSAPITALVGSNPTRLYPDTILQGSTRPALAYQRIDTVRAEDVKGESTLARVRIQLTIHANDPTARQNVYEAIVNTFKGYKDVANGIDRILVRDGRDNYEPSTKVYERYTDLIVWVYE